VAGVPVEVLLGRRPLVRRLERLERRLDELVTALSNPRLLAHLLGGLPAPARRELQSIAGETAALVGGLSFRLESRCQAGACYAFARHLAQESGDRELEAYALGLESSLASAPATSGVPYPATNRGAGDAIALLDEAEAAARSVSTVAAE